MFSGRRVGNDDIATVAILGGFGAALGSVSRVFIHQFGRTFSQYQGMAHLGMKSGTLLSVMGVVQQIFPLFLKRSLQQSGLRPPAAGFVAHALTAGALFGLTQLAFKAGMISQALTPVGGVVFCLTSYLVSRSLFGSKY